jgi:hypothetical protein
MVLLLSRVHQLQLQILLFRFAQKRQKSKSNSQTFGTQFGTLP